MISKKILATLTFIAALFFLFSSISYAASWHYCTVEETGTAFNTMFIKLTDTENDPPLFENTYFIPHPDAEKEMLATALTAVSLDKTVRVKLDGTDANSIIEAIFLAK